MRDPQCPANTAVEINSITPEQEYRKSGYVEKKRRLYQENVVRFAWRKLFYGGYRIWSEVSHQNGPKVSARDWDIHLDCSQGHKAAEKTARFYPAACPARLRLSSHGAPLGCPKSGKLFVGGSNQPVHKLDQTLLVHGILVQHEANVPLPAQGGKHIQLFSFRLR